MLISRRLLPCCALCFQSFLLSLSLLLHRTIIHSTYVRYSCSYSDLHFSWLLFRPSFFDAPTSSATQYPPFHMHLDSDIMLALPSLLTGLAGIGSLELAEHSDLSQHSRSIKSKRVEKGRLPTYIICPLWYKLTEMG